MLPYWLLFAFCAVGAIEHRRRENIKFQGGPLLALLAMTMALLVGLRFEVGGDWNTYTIIFEHFRYARASELWLSDPGYSLLNLVAHRLGFGLWFVNLVSAAFFIWGLLVFARSQPNPWLVLVVAVPYLVIVIGMGYTRQAVAIGFLLAGLAALQRRALTRFLVYVVLAATFHKTAVLLLPIVGFSLAQQRAAYALLVLATGVLLYFTFLQSAVDQLLLTYEEARYESEGAAIRVAMNLVPASLFLTLRRHFDLPPFQAGLWRVFSFASFGALALLLVLESSTAVDRIALYLIPVQLFVLSRLPYALSRDRGRANPTVVLAVIAYSATVQFVWLNYASHAEYWLPYQFYPLAVEESELG